MKIEKDTMNVLHLGREDYLTAYEIQKHLHDLRKNDLIEDTFIFAEHNPVITLGSIETWNKIHATHEEIKALGLEIYKADRGGGAACLCPGQVIVYSIINLIDRKIDIGKYHRLLEQVAFNVAHNYGINAHFEEEILEVDFNGLKKGKKYQSVWYRDNGRNYKFFAQGHKISRDSTMYGFTLFINKESLKYMHLIDPCGFDKEKIDVISFEDILERKIDLVDARNKIVNELKNVFHYNKIRELKREGILALKWQG